MDTTQRRANVRTSCTQLAKRIRVCQGTCTHGRYTYANTAIYVYVHITNMECKQVYIHMYVLMIYMHACRYVNKYVCIYGRSCHPRAWGGLAANLQAFRAMCQPACCCIERSLSQESSYSAIIESSPQNKPYPIWVLSPKIIP